MIYFACFELAPKDKETMLKSVTKEQFRDSLQNMIYLNPEIANEKKFRRKQPEMSQQAMQTYLEAHSKAKFEILKCEPKVMHLVTDIIASKLDSLEYPFIGERPVPKRSNDQDILRGAT